MELERRICLGLHSERFFYDGDELWRATDITLLNWLKTCKWTSTMTTDELRAQIKQIEKRVKDHKIIVEFIL
jgi:hypothetical protein